MPVHDWTKVDVAVVHDFSHTWIAEISRILNGGVLPSDHYALIEPRNADLRQENDTVGETDSEFYRRKQSRIAVKHASGDKVVAVIEIVSPGNKSSVHAIHSFVGKAEELLDRGIHLLMLDLFPPGPRDPQGIHASLWDDMEGGQPCIRPADKPLTLAAYEADLSTRAYVECFAVGDSLVEMPLFLRPHAHVPVPLEKTYESAFAAVPKRWRGVLEAK